MLQFLGTVSAPVGLRSSRSERLEPQENLVGLGKGAKAVGVNSCLQPEYGILESGAEMIPLTYSREVLVV